MTSATSPYPEAPPPPPPPAEAPPAASGWTGTDLAIGGALVVLVVALFLPWFSVTVSPGSGVPAIAGTGNGPTAHGYLWTVFVLAIVALIVLVARDAIVRLPGNLPSPEQILVGTTGLALLLTILGVVQKPSPVTTSGPVSRIFPHFAFSVGWSYGGFVAVLAALVAFIAAFGIAGPLESAHRAAQGGLRRRGRSA